MLNCIKKILITAGLIACCYVPMTQSMEHKKPKKVKSLFTISQEAVLDSFFQKNPKKIAKKLKQLPVELIESLATLVNQPIDDYHNTLLHIAASPVKVKQSLALGADTTIRNIHGQTPLIRLLKAVEAEAAITLLQNSVNDVNAADRFSETPLALAKQLGNLKLKNLLREQGACEPFLNKLKNFFSLSAPATESMEQQKNHAHFKCFMGHSSLQESINYFYDALDEAAQKGLQSVARRPVCNAGITQLHIAKTELDVQKLLFLDADLHATTENNENPLHYMIKLGNIAAAEQLLKHLRGSSAIIACNCADNYQMTPLCTAVAGGKFLLVQKLIYRGADVNYTFTDNNNNCITVFHYALPYANKWKMLDFLFAKSTIRKNRDLLFPLMCSAIEQDNPYMLHKLLRKGFTLDTFVHDDCNILMYALCKGKHACAMELLTNNATLYNPTTQRIEKISMNLLAPNNNGVTPLMFATAFGDYEATEQLLTMGSNINDADNAGDTALLHAAEHGHHTIVELLLKKGALVNHQNAEGVSALHCAAAKKNTVLAEILLNAHADPLLADNKGETPLDLAADPDNLSFYKLLKKGIHS